MGGCGGWGQGTGCHHLGTRGDRRGPRREPSGPGTHRHPPQRGPTHPHEGTQWSRQPPGRVPLPRGVRTPTELLFLRFPPSTPSLILSGAIFLPPFIFLLSSGTRGLLLRFLCPGPGGAPAGSADTWLRRQPLPQPREDPKDPPTPPRIPHRPPTSPRNPQCPPGTPMPPRIPQGPSQPPRAPQNCSQDVSRHPQPPQGPSGASKFLLMIPNTPWDPKTPSGTPNRRPENLPGTPKHHRGSLKLPPGSL